MKCGVPVVSVEDWRLLTSWVRSLLLTDPKLGPGDGGDRCGTAPQEGQRRQKRWEVSIKVSISFTIINISNFLSAPQKCWRQGARNHFNCVGMAPRCPRCHKTKYLSVLIVYLCWTLFENMILSSKYSWKFIIYYWLA